MGSALPPFAREMTPASVDSTNGVPSSPHAGKKPTGPILVIDHEPLIRWCLRESLQRDGLEVEEAADAEDARRLLTADADRFAAVILDYDHRFCDPIDLTVLRQIRRMAPHLPVLLLTACPEPAMRAEAISCGAIGVVDQPFDVVALTAQIRAALDRTH